MFDDYEMWVFGLCNFESEYIIKDMVGVVCCSFRNCGFVIFECGFMNEDGVVGGVGYVIIKKGREYVE